MKTISFEKMSFESSDILTRLQMKKVKGGHGSFCECSCNTGPGTWHYTAPGDPNTAVQPSAAAIDRDIAQDCGEGGGSCTGCTNY